MNNNWICPECGWNNSAGQKECIGCGVLPVANANSPDETATNATMNRLTGSIVKSGVPLVVKAIIGVATVVLATVGGFALYNSIKEAPSVPLTSNEPIFSYDISTSPMTVEEVPTVASETSTEQAGGQTDYNNMQIADIIPFGGYEWRVLDLQNEQALIIMESMAEYRPFNTGAYTGNRIWADSDIRHYLNGEFYNSFNENDKTRIIMVTNENPRNKWYSTEGEPDTDDYIFLLSIDDVVKYFGDSGQFDNPLVVDEYSWDGFDLMIIDDQFNENRVSTYVNNANWWLRTPGYSEYSLMIAIVGNNGIIGLSGLMDDDYCGIRPAMWVNLHNYSPSPAPMKQVARAGDYPWIVENVDNLTITQFVAYLEKANSRFYLANADKSNFIFSNGYVTIRAYQDNYGYVSIESGDGDSSTLIKANNHWYIIDDKISLPIAQRLWDRLALSQWHTDDSYFSALSLAIDSLEIQY